MLGLNLLVPAVTSILDKLIPDPAEKAKAQIKLMELAQAGDLKELDSAMTIISAEASSEHWVVAAWRPIVALMLAFIVANNYIVYPYLSLFIDSAPKLDIPPDLWDLLKLMIGGYVVSRGVEKSVKTWKSK